MDGVDKIFGQEGKSMRVAFTLKIVLLLPKTMVLRTCADDKVFIFILSSSVNSRLRHFFDERESVSGCPT